MNPAAMNIICENMPTQTANVRTYEHGLPEHEYYCKRIRELEGLNSIQRDALAEQTNAIRELEAELTQWKQMWKPHCETDRAIEAELRDERESRKWEHKDIVDGHREALARAERAEARVKELEALITDASEALHRWNKNLGSGHAVEAFHKLTDEVAKTEAGSGEDGERTHLRPQ